MILPAGWLLRLHKCQNSSSRMLKSCILLRVHCTSEVLKNHNQGHMLLPVSPPSPFSDLCHLPSSPRTRTSQDPPGLPRPQARHHCGCGWEQVTPGCPYLRGPCSHCDLAEDHHTGTVDPPPLAHLSNGCVGPTGVGTYSPPQWARPTAGHWLGVQSLSWLGGGQRGQQSGGGQRGYRGASGQRFRPG